MSTVMVRRIELLRAQVSSLEMLLNNALPESPNWWESVGACRLEIDAILDGRRDSPEEAAVYALEG